MPSVLLAFFIIMLAGGGIAWLGDRLGYVMGRKRVTLLGLRPRHTATVFTVAAGVIIGGLTLLFLVGINRAFRQALFTGEAEIRTNIRLMKSNRRLNLLADTNLDAALRAEHAADLAKAQAEDARQILLIAQQNLAREQKKTSAIQQQLVLKQSALGKLTMALENEQVQLASVQSSVKLEESRLRQDVQTRRGGNLIFRNYGELGRQVISPSESPAAIRDELVRFLNRQSQLASAKGAALGVNGRSVVVASIELLNAKSSASGAFVDESGSLDALASSIHSYRQGKESVVVISRVFGNSFGGEQVIVILRPYANVLAFRAGSVIGETIINANSLQVDEIVGQLQSFLVTQVRPAAIRAGMIPVINPLTGKVELGDITVQQIYDIVNQIRQVNGPAVVTASAASDFYAADQLKLNFSVRPESPGVN